MHATILFSYFYYCYYARLVFFSFFSLFFFVACFCFKYANNAPPHYKFTFPPPPKTDILINTLRVSIWICIEAYSILRIGLVHDLTVSKLLHPIYNRNIVKQTKYCGKIIPTSNCSFYFSIVYVTWEMRQYKKIHSKILNMFICFDKELFTCGKN
jgi:hypothetical protein